MDSTDCLISEFDYKSLTPSSSDFVSPGPSSGYCSSEENFSQSRVGTNFDSKIQNAQLRSSDSLWRGDAFPGVHSIEPSLVDSSTTGSLAGIDDGSFDFGTSPLNFDDLMDTFWNPIRSDFPSYELITDFDMSDVSQSTGVNAMVSNRSDPGLASLAKVGMTTQPSQSKPGWQKRAASPSKEAPGLAKKPSNPSQTSTGVRTSSAESQKLLRKVFDFQHQVARLDDMVVGDEEDYVLQFVMSNNGVTSRVTESTVTSATSTVAPAPVQSSALLSSVFSQRGAVPATLKNCDSKALSRIRGGAVASSCGTLLRHTVSVPSNVKSAAAASSNSATSGRESMAPPRGASIRSQNGHRSCTRSDMRGGRANASLLALDDHRYTLKQVHSPPAPKSSRGRKTTSSSASNTNTSVANSPCLGKMSILEAFLRSTRPLDPNKGSNAALAAEGLAHLRIEADDDSDTKSSGTILKKLLTGEIDQSEVRRCEEQVIQERANCSASVSPIEPVLTDGFGLGAELLLDGSDPNLLCDDIESGGLWNDEVLSSELDEILREQTRQDDLWLRHYINCL